MTPAYLTMPPLDMTAISQELAKPPPPPREPDFGPGPLPGTYIVPAAQLADLLADHDRLTRLEVFLRGHEASVFHAHSSEPLTNDDFEENVDGITEI